ncbi:hypothetical protein MTO96_010365 [Rhipicephalus appendiculatus]|uniref:Cyclin A3 n=1 Tax=Rhipicephalus appendiculatus TaxID=34631 RepID=A0A131YNT4_RHIAP
MTYVERWWLTDYTPEIYVYLRKLERRRMNFQSQSPQVHHRGRLVAFISAVCSRMDFCTLVQHLSVHFLDFFMDSHNIAPEHLELVALGCVVVAAKAEEKDCRNPLNSEISKLMGNAYTLREIGEAERAVLHFFRWEVNHPTVAHFLEYFAVFGLLPYDKPFSRVSAEMLQLREAMKHQLDFFLEASLKDYMFTQMPASMVAASCVVSARVCMCIYPYWSTTLEKITDYKLEQLVFCTNQLLMARDREYAKNGPRPQEFNDYYAVGFPYYYDIMALQDAESRHEDRRAAWWPVHSSQYEV